MQDDLMKHLLTMESFAYSKGAGTHVWEAIKAAKDIAANASTRERESGELLSRAVKIMARMMREFESHSIKNDQLYDDTEAFLNDLENARRGSDE